MGPAIVDATYTGVVGKTMSFSYTVAAGVCRGPCLASSPPSRSTRDNPVAQMDAVRRCASPAFGHPGRRRRGTDQATLAKLSLRSF